METNSKMYKQQEQMHLTKVHYVSRVHCIDDIDRIKLVFAPSGSHRSCRHPGKDPRS